MTTGGSGQLLAGKVALVTGAGRGLGRSHALTLAAAGAAVVVNDVGSGVRGGGSDPGPADEVVREIVEGGGAAVADHTDVGSVAGGEAVVAAVLDAFGRIDVVVNNAGISRPSPLVDMDDDNIDAHIAVHLKAAIGTTKAAFRSMRDGGTIVNTTSGAGLDPTYGGSVSYGCAKAGVYSLTRTAAIEGAPLNIRVNAISPLARTRMADGFLDQAYPTTDPTLLDPSHASQAVLFLASDLSVPLTGRILRLAAHEASEVSMATTEYQKTDSVSPRRVPTRWISSGSSRIARTLIRGSRLENGSWKTICSWRRSGRMRAAERPSSRVPS